MPPSHVDLGRRRFMHAVSAAPAAAALVGVDGRVAATASARQAAASSGAPPDLPLDVPPSAADLGSNFARLQALDAGGAYPGSFLQGRFDSVEAFTAAGRASILDAYAYRPEATLPAAEVVDRFDGPDFIREKVVFSTTPHFRVPAYVHIPKGRTGRLPAIVDLHSHGGMFIFGKEKVIDFGRNHPAMTAYHAGNYESRPTATALVKRGYVVITIDAFMFG